MENSGIASPLLEFGSYRLFVVEKKERWNLVAGLLPPLGIDLVTVRGDTCRLRHTDFYLIIW
jgi:hypothetical protein